MPTKLALRLGLASAALASCLAFATPSLAAKGGGGGSLPANGTIGLVLLNSTDGLPHVGQKVTFNVSTSATRQPWVTLDCYQAGTLVYKASNGIFATSLNEVFTLASNSWMTGAADCTAWLQDWDSFAKHGTIQNLASTSFHVYG